MTADATPRLELRGITKRYPGCLANDRIDLAVMPGEVHALLGENGAGKSTLVKVIYGVAQADAGEMHWQGEVRAAHNPAEARRMGIGMVFQHFNLFETLTVTENIALGLDDAGDLKALAARIAEVSERYGLPVHPRRHVHSLSVGERQRVEIVRCLLQDPKLLIMDEPTSVLAPQEVAKLFVTLRRLAAEGCSILYISHKLGEIMELAERATVLRGGRVSATCNPAEETPKSLAEMMIGGELPVCRHSEAPGDGAVRLGVAGLDLPAEDPFGTDLRDIRFEVRAGEILGIAGVAGNGQKELLAALSGERLAPAAEQVAIDGRPVGRLGPAKRRAAGLAFVPEERLGRGAVPELDLAANALLTGYHRDLVAHGFIRPKAVQAAARSVIDGFNVVCTGPAAEAQSLSGGNLQKFIIGREIGLAPKVLVLAHPTWGVDVGAATAIRQALIDLRRGGAAVLVVSEDLDELFEISDRIAVIAGGRVTAPKPTRDAGVEEIGRAMAGMDDAPGEQDAA